MSFKLLFVSILLLLAAIESQFYFPKLVNILWFLSFMASFLYINYPIKLKLPAFKIDFVLVAILTLATLLRVIDLTSLPYQLHGDEAEIGLGALSIMKGLYANIAGVGWYDVPLLSFVFPIPFFYLFGAHLFALRITSVILGLISVYLLYALAKLLTQNRSVALISAFILSVFALHIHYSRTGFHYMQAVTFVLLTFYFFWKGIIKRDFKFFVYTGYAAGLSLQVYYSARIIIPILGIFIITQFAMHKKTREYIDFIKYSAYGFIFTFLPMLVVFMQNSNAFLSRTHEVLIFDKLAHLSSEYDTSNFYLILYKQTIKTFLYFFGGHDASLQYGYQMGDILTSLLFFSGLIFFIWHMFKKDYFYFMVIWVAGMLLSIIFTIDAPFSPRLVPISPAVAFIAAYAVYAIFQYLKKYNSQGAMLLMAAALVSTALFNIKIYFSGYRKEQPINQQTKEVYQLKSGCFRDRSVDLEYPTVRFLAPGVTYCLRKD